MTEARRITSALGGHWLGSYGLAMCPAHHNTKTPALSLSDATDGRLLLRCHAGCSFLSILDALRGLGVVEGHGTIPRTDPAEMALREAEERREAEKRARQAQACWSEALPIGATIAEAYLRGRGITCTLPDTLRFHPQCWHGATAQRIPAMIGLVQGVAHFAVHRTYLAHDGSGKAGVQPDKAMLGNVTGGAVRVSGGHDALAVGEGIETALSLLCGPLRGSVAIWAALSAGGMKTLHLPSRPGALIVATDGDEPGRASGAALAAKAEALGWTVTMLPAPEGADWNDVIRDPRGGRT